MKFALLMNPIPNIQAKRKDEGALYSTYYFNLKRKINTLIFNSMAFKGTSESQIISCCTAVHK